MRYLAAVGAVLLSAALATPALAQNSFTLRFVAKENHTVGNFVIIAGTPGDLVGAGGNKVTIKWLFGVDVSSGAVSTTATESVDPADLQGIVTPTVIATPSGTGANAGGGGGILGGGNPGIGGGTPGIAGGDPGIFGGSPGILGPNISTAGGDPGVRGGDPALRGQTQGGLTGGDPKLFLPGRRD